MGSEGLNNIAVKNGTYAVGATDEATNMWVASFNNFVRGAPPPVTLRNEGVRLIESESGCGVIQESVVVDLKWASVHAQVSCQ